MTRSVAMAGLASLPGYAHRPSSLPEHRDGQTQRRTARRRSVPDARRPGGHPRGHRRLGVRALARQLLPGRTGAAAGAGIRQRPPHRDRDQRHLLRHPAAGHLRQVARCHAGGLHVLGQGAQAHHPVAQADRHACAGGGFHRRHRRTGRQARAAGVAVRGRAQDRCRAVRRLPRPAAEEGRQAHAAARAGRARSGLHHARLPGPGPRARHGYRVLRIHRISLLRRYHRRLRLCAPDGQPQRRGHRLSGGRTGCLGAPRTRLARRRGPEELPHVGPTPAPKQPREVFVFFISAAKERNPAAAMALLERLRK